MVPLESISGNPRYLGTTICKAQCTDYGKVCLKHKFIENRRHYNNIGFKNKNDFNQNDSMLLALCVS
jgi:hypothetical protein